MERRRGTVRAMIELSLKGPGKNAVSTQMMDQVLDQLERAGGEPILITGADDAFSAGLNLKEVATLDAPGMESFLRKLEALYSALFTYAGPTAAAVNGHAIAGGCLIAMACDVRICTSDARARIGLNEVALGLQFPPGILHLVRAVVPPHRLTEVLLGAGLHGPEGALRLGLVDALSEDPVREARAALEALARHPAEAYAHAKRAVRGAGTYSAADEPAFQAILPFWTSPALKERIAAMFRKP